MTVLRPGSKLWIAEAPDGFSRNPPAVIFDLSEYGIDTAQLLDHYRIMGWTVTPVTVIDEEGRDI